jgi:hypothetical protein
MSKEQKIIIPWFESLPRKQKDYLRDRFYESGFEDFTEFLSVEMERRKVK